MNRTESASLTNSSYLPLTASHSARTSGVEAPRSTDAYGRINRQPDAGTAAPAPLPGVLLL